MIEMAAPEEFSPRLLLSVRETADQLRLSEAKVYALIASGEIASIQIGRARRVPYDALVEFVDRLREGAHT